MRMKIPALLALALSGLLALTACGSSKGSAGSAKASARAIASSKAAVAAKAEWDPVVHACAAHRHWVLRPIVSSRLTITCAGKSLTPAQRKAAEQCASAAIITNGFGHGKLGKDENSIAICLARQKPRP